MDRLWAPWRMEYIKMERKNGCIFCEKPQENKDDKNFILYRGKTAFVILNIFPYNNGHLMVAPYEHIANLEELQDDTLLEISHLLQKMIIVLKKAMSPHGFNVGMNLGETAGAGIPGHLHWHIVPRWNGDTNFMPVISNTKVIVQSLENSYMTLKKFL